MSNTAVPIQPIKQGSVIRLWIGVGLALLAGVALAWWGTSRAVASKGNAEAYLAWNGSRMGVTTTKSGLQYQIIEKGEGTAKPTDTDVALIGYKGALQDGKVFDQNEQAPMPVKRVVPGFSEALKLMTKKSRYRFWIPPALGYGASPPPGAPIPPNALLVFDVQMHDIMTEKQFEQLMMQQQMMQQMRQQGGKGAPGGAGGN